MSDNTKSTDTPALHFGVFRRPETAAHAVKNLKKAGFLQEQISVLCSDDAKQKFFRNYEHQKPAGANTNHALNVAGLAGLGLGSAAAVTGLLTSAGISIFVVGALSGIALAGPFISLMITRGAEKELADFYDQALVHGQILLAAEHTDDEMLKQADRIFRDLDAQPGQLPREPGTPVAELHAKKSS